jgi:protein-disulfide isomerase
MFAQQDALLARVGPDQMPPNAEQILSGMTPQQAAAWWANQAGYREFMMQHGLPGPKVDACLADSARLTEVTKVNQTAVDDLNVQGTPTFFINGAKVEAGEWAQLEPLLRNAGAR